MYGGESKRLVYALLALLVVAGIALAVTGSDHGLPHVVHPDEGFEINRALKLGGGVFDLDRTMKGGLYFVLFLLYGAFFAFLFVTGAVSSPGEFETYYALHPGPFWLIGRLTIALISGAIVLMAFRLARRTYGSRAGLVASLATVCSVQVVISGHLVNVDLPMTLMVLLSLHELCRWADPETKPRPIRLGLLMGGALLCKMPAAILVFPTIAAQWRRGQGQPLLQRYTQGSFWWCGLVTLLVLGVGNPGLFVNLRHSVLSAAGTVAGVGDVPAHPDSGGAGTNLWVFYANAAARSFGWPLLVVACAGVVRAVWKRRREELVLLAFAVPFFLLIAGSATTHLYYARYFIVLLPILGCLAGGLLVDLASQLRTSEPTRSILLGVISLGLVVPAGLETGRWLASYARGDTRLEAITWIERTIPPGEAIFMIGNPVVRSALTVPLRNIPANLKSIADGLREETPGKARIVEARTESGDGVPYDLRAVPHNESNRTLDAYLQAGVTTFVVLGHQFHPDRVAADTRRSSSVLQSRLALYRSLTSRAGVRLAHMVDPEELHIYGPIVEIYRVSK